MMLVSIADNGVGVQNSFNLGELGESGHFGLLGISERVALLGGRLHFQNLAEGGLFIQVEIPHPRVTHQE